MTRKSTDLGARSVCDVPEHQTHYSINGEWWGHWFISGKDMSGSLSSGCPGYVEPPSPRREAVIKALHDLEDDCCTEAQPCSGAQMVRWHGETADAVLAALDAL